MSDVNDSKGEVSELRLEGTGVEELTSEENVAALADWLRKLVEGPGE
jgi:hypothetical protein